MLQTPVHERINTPEGLERIRQTIPLLRIGVPEEVSGMVSFLCTDDASYMTGAIIPINGGRMMRPKAYRCSSIQMSALQCIIS
ncbi:MAG: SDR family oxidoreductase [Clostridiales bacterium]|nr:SDR family oxidoreductase [Clostridiales bacterium]